VRAGEADALMKGSLHTDELMAEVLRKDVGIRTARRVSHVFIMDVPTYPKPLFITDAAVNISPTLEDKADIVQNAIELAQAMRISLPKVAILSALETINSPVAGDADILLVPDLEAGNMLAKELSFLANADAAGIVLGARVPIILTSRADNLRTRMASCAVAALYAHARRMAIGKLAG
jgi:phosphate acetyltransferase